MPFTLRPKERDTKCPDGVTCYGWRRVNKGGYVRFANRKHYHGDLATCVGTWVYVTLADMWGNIVDVYTDAPWHGQPLRCANEREWNGKCSGRTIFSTGDAHAK
jgi:hypothetical protein